MQQQSLSTDSERDSLRALIDQKTKEWEAQNGKIETLDIVKKDPAAPDYYRKSTDVAPAVEDIKATNKAIAERYPTAECLPTLAKDLGISPSSLSNRASRLEVKRIRNKQQSPSADAKPSAVKPVKPVKKTTQTTALTERSAHDFRQQLTAINKEADAIEAKINAIASIGKRSHETAG